MFPGLAAIIRQNIDDQCGAIDAPGWTCANPHFSPALYCGGDPGMSTALHSVGLLDVRRVRLRALGRAPCIHARLHRLATKPGEKCGLIAVSICKQSSVLSDYLC